MSIATLAGLLTPTPAKCCIFGCDQLCLVVTHYPTVIDSAGSEPPTFQPMPVGWTVFSTCREHAGIADPRWSW